MTSERKPKPKPDFRVDILCFIAAGLATLFIANLWGTSDDHNKAIPYGEFRGSGMV